jgi:hypothetical protein
VNVAGHCALKASELKWSGILAAVLAAKAMENGFDVKVTGALPVRKLFVESDHDYLGLVPVKRYDESISLANLAPLEIS